MSLLGFGAFGGCGGGQAHFAELEDGAYLRGEQPVRLVVADQEVVSGELYLDDELAAILVPAEGAGELTGVLATERFAEAPHRLRARAHLSGGGHVDQEIGVIIDNTPPTIGEPSPGVHFGSGFYVHAADNFAIEQYEVIGALEDAEDPATRRIFEVGRKPSVSELVPWRRSCGPATITVVARDAAGWVTERAVSLEGSDYRDNDCDGHRSRGEGGDDCDDTRRWVHPGAAEPPEGFELSCDDRVASLPGLDSDGDGVASFADGGDDCDDTDAAIHGAFLAHAHTTLVSSAGPVTWQPGEARIAPGSGLILNRGGVIEQVVRGAGARVTLRTLATGATPGTLTVGWKLVAFARGGEVVILRDTDAGWREHRVIAAGAVGKVGIGELRFAPDVESRVSVAFEADRRLWLAQQDGEGRWTPEAVLGLDAALAAPPVVHAAGAWARIVYQTAQQMWIASRPEAGGRFTRAQRGAPTSQLQAGIAELHLQAIATSDEGGSLLQVWREAEPGVLSRRFAQRITALHVASGYLVVQLEGGETQLVQVRGELRAAQTLSGLGAIEHVAGYHFVGASVLHEPGAGMVYPSADPLMDHADRNCNSFDY